MVFSRSTLAYVLVTSYILFAAVPWHSGPRAPSAVLAAGPGEVRLTPQDTSLNINATNYSSDSVLSTYTWPDNKIANAVLMKFDLSSLPAGASVTGAMLHLALIESDAAADPTYQVSVHKVLGRNPVISAATGFTSDGTVNWTANACCYNGVPLAQADISAAYAQQAIDRTPGFKAWDVTTLVQEWLADASSNRGLLLNSDGSKPRDRYRYFASMEYPNAALRPFLQVTFTAGDATPPSVTMTAPAAGATVSDSTTLRAVATDDVRVESVQFELDGAPIGGALSGTPYTLDWDTTGVADGAHRLDAVARDWAGNVATSAPLTVTTRNGVLLLAPQDTWLNVNATNNSTGRLLRTYTWPDFKVKNAVLMKFDLSAIPPATSITSASLHLTMVQSDATPDATYAVSVHKVLGRNPVIARATGQTADGVVKWTANACCYNNVPLAQADISPFYDVRGIGKTPGPATWNVTALVREWLADQASNFGLLLNPDTSKAQDRYRYFASGEHEDARLRPFLRITLAGGDDTPPSITGAAASAITGSGATITWTTDEPGDSQVEYGQTSAYGSTSPRDGAFVTSHTVTLSGLAGATTYHARVHSRDAAGNLATSPDFTFTTRDGTAPTVSITAPAAGATVSGTVSVTAAASDNVGVVGVQFKVDGTNFGSEDTAAPYTASWNTTTFANGSHTLTAVARDAAGNQKTSAALTVTVSNGSPPPPSGIAALYPGDTGIEGHPDVVFVERFEEATLGDLFARWSDTKNGPSMSFTADVPGGSPGARSLNIPWTGGGVSDGGHLFRQVSPGVDTTLYVRYYIKYPTNASYDHSGIWMGGNNPPQSWPNPQAGIRPAGNDRFIAGAEQDTALSRFDHYDYWMTMRQSQDGNYWGNLLLNNPNVTARSGQWMCVEHMVKLNTPTTAFNGEHAIWLDGVKVSHLGQGFPNGSWSGGIFTQSSSGSPFEGFRWRSDANLKLNWIWLQVYAPDSPAGFNSSIKFDHVVVAKSYVGCLTSGGGGGDTVPPTVSITAPSNGATVSGTTTVSANASDNVGVAGVQLKLDGANLGAEDTSAPFSISWDTRTVPNGSHTLTAVARDAAGNRTTSPAVSLTVSNGGSGGVMFDSTWDTATGTSANAVTDGGRWPNYWEFNNGTGVQLLSIVAGGPNGHNALRVQQRGSSYAANLQIDNFMPQSTDYYLRFYMKNEDTSTEGDHVVTVDTWQYPNLTYVRKSAGASSWRYIVSLYGCGFTYPIGHWSPAQTLANGQWYRFEYRVDFIDATHVQVHPRVYDAAGNLILSDADIRQQDFGSASWNGRSDWTLASYYAAGHSFCVNPTWLNDLGLGNNGQSNASDTGRYWYFSGIQIRTDTWPGAMAPR